MNKDRLFNLLNAPEQTSFLKGNFGGVPFESLGYTASKNFALNQNYNNYQYCGNVSNSSICGNNCGNSNITNAGAGTIVGGDYVVRNKNSNGKEGRLFSKRSRYNSV